jgi:hypothetical protein
MMSKIFVLGMAAIFLLYGLLFFVIPIETFQFVVDGTVTSSSGVTDLRATYGGMSVGVGVILYMLGMSPQMLKMGLVSVFVLMFGMAFGRSVGIVFDGNTNSYMYIYLVLEIAASFVSLVLIKVDGSVCRTEKST